VLRPPGEQSFLDTSDVFQSVSELSLASSAGQGGVKMGSVMALMCASGVPASPGSLAASQGWG